MIYEQYLTLTSNDKRLFNDTVMSRFNYFLFYWQSGGFFENIKISVTVVNLCASKKQEDTLYKSK